MFHLTFDLNNFAVDICLVVIDFFVVMTPVGNHLGNLHGNLLGVYEVSAPTEPLCVGYIPRCRSLRYLHNRGPKARGCVNRVETEPRLVYNGLVPWAMWP